MTSARINVREVLNKVRFMISSPLAFRLDGMLYGGMPLVTLWHRKPILFFRDQYITGAMTNLLQEKVVERKKYGGDKKSAQRSMGACADLFI
jgi:hypothetical protein